MGDAAAVPSESGDAMGDMSRGVLGSGESAC